jgi:hypothetical protein
VRHRSPSWSVLSGLVAAAILTAPTGARQSAPDTSVKAVIRAAAAYLAEYQARLSFLLADEHATQQVFDAGGRETARRTMTGELFVTFLPADRAWISVHDTAEVDGRPIEDREDLRELLGREPVAGAARLLVNRNARFNIGTITRNFNKPTLGLLVLERRRVDQFKFSRVRLENDGAAAVVTLGFKEVDRPTLVRGVDGRDLFSSGELQVEAGTGRIRRTSIRFVYGPASAQLTTTYAPEPKLDTWVPSVFTERYERTKGDREVIFCEAAYTNYRRFDVKVIVK